MGEISYDDFMADPQLVDAVMFRLVQLIENTKEISAGFKANHPEIPWGKIIGFRNGIVHEYGHTDYHVVYEVAKRDLADLEDVLQLAMDGRL